MTDRPSIQCREGLGAVGGRRVQWMRTSRFGGFSAMLLSTMGLSTFAFFAIAVAASEIEAEFGISKFEIGLLGAINTLVGGIFAPAAGRLSDTVGGRTAMAITLGLSAASAVAIAVSTSYLFLLLAMAFAGLPQGLGNPASNKAIADGIAEAKRGILTGIKQSGVQAAVFVSGFAVPWLTAEFGWRSSMWVLAVISAVAMLGIGLIPPPSEERPKDSDGTRSAAPLSTFVNQVAIYGFLLGVVGGGLGRFLPLFAEEQVGFSLEQAGRVFGVQGLIAIPTRLISGILLDRGVSARLMLAIMGAFGALSVLLILAASGGAASFLWIGTVLGGMTLGAWNTAANLSMIRQPDAGRATGRLILGFLIGLTVGGPLVGWSIDSFGYSPAWIGSAIFALLGTAVIARRPRDSQPSVRLGT